MSNIPKLRFPEFTGNWEKKKLGEVVTIIDSGWSPQCEEYPSGGDEWGVLKTTAVVWEGFNEFENKKLPDRLTPRKELEVHPKDILITRAGPRSRVGVTVHVESVREKLMLSDKIIRIRTKNDYLEKFTAISLAVDKAQQQLFGKSSGLASSQTNISQDIVLSVILDFPTLAEQTRIATFLTAVDSKLQSLKKKKSLLEEYKKGVMQRIFLSEKVSELGLVGLEDDRIENDEEENPSILQSKKSKFRQLRFKIPNEVGELVEPPEWEVKKLGEVCDIKKGEQLNKEELTEIGIYPCLNGGINASGFTEKFNSNENTITISEGGNSCGFVNFMNTKFWLGGHCYKIILHPEIELKYFYQLLKFYEVKIMKLRVGSGLPNIQQKDLRNFEFLISNSFEEQTRIANFLSAIDEKINHCQKQIEKTEAWKKGLLQKLFV